LATVLGSDGSGAEYLSIPAGGSKLPASRETIDNRLHYIKMNGREVYRFATRVMGRAAKQACEKAGIGLDEIDLFIPHQANIRIIQSARKYLKISEEKVFTNLDKYGNTSAASIPIALCEAIDQGRIQANDKLVMVGFGGGLTWGATVVDWGVPMPHQHRQWWYRALRWMLYRWARIRSYSRRQRRLIESWLPPRNGHSTPLPEEEQTDAITETHSNNGTEPQPIDETPELSVTQLEEIEEEMLEKIH
jgi:3-oxoacyl-[acyl-carrier-protein] synthase-3